MSYIMLEMPRATTAKDEDMIFADMNKQERIAWVMAAGHLLIAVWLINNYMALLTLQDGILTNLPGLLPLSLKAIGFSIALEIACNIITHRKVDAVDVDERDRSIAFRANHVAHLAFGGLVCIAVFSLIPWNVASIQAVSTGTMGGALICLFSIASLSRRAAAVVQYRMGL